MKRKTAVYILLMLAVPGISASSVFLYAISQSRAFDKFEVANAQFRIRVVAYHEFTPRALPGARYVFQSAAVGSDHWSDIKIIKADQAVPIPRRQIRFVSDQIGYVFLDNYYMMTTDGGLTWPVWDANRELPVKEFMQKYNLWPAIEEIELQPNGTGKMRLHKYLTAREKGPLLLTADYGRHWKIEK